MDDEDAMSEPIDDSVRGLAAMGYNTPDGLVPREEMWARIAAARRAARVVAARADGAGIDAPADVTEIADVRRGPTPARVVPIDSRRRTIQRWSAALAAGLILGIAVDRALVARLSTRGVAGDSTQAMHEAQGDEGATTTRASAPTSANGGSSAPALTPGAPIAVAPTESSSARSSIATRSSNAPSTGLSRTPRSTEPPLVASAPNNASVPSAPDPRDLYHAAAVQTLVQAEALLTAYRRGGDAADPQSMQQAARWARDILSSTRLLMDSPAARDPQMRALFTDLELVLVQIVQLSGAPLAAPERDLIERALRDRDLLPRLRSAVPAGLATS